MESDLNQEYHIRVGTSRRKYRTSSDSHSFDIAEFGRSLQHLKATVDELLKRASDLDRELSEIRDKSSKQGTESSKSRDEFSKAGNESSQPSDEYSRLRNKFSKPDNEPSQRDNGSVRLGDMAVLLGQFVATVSQDDESDGQHAAVVTEVAAIASYLIEIAGRPASGITQRGIIAMDLAPIASQLTELAGRGPAPKSSSGAPSPGGEPESIFGNKDRPAAKQSPSAKASAAGEGWLKPQEGRFRKMAQGFLAGRSSPSAAGKPP
jgi:hypothetical protein